MRHPRFLRKCPTWGGGAALGLILLLMLGNCARLDPPIGASGASLTPWVSSLPQQLEATPWPPVSSPILSQPSAAFLPASPSPTVAFLGDSTPTPLPSPISVPVAHTHPETTPPPLTPATAACDRQTGHFEHGSLETDLLPDPLAFRIYLPPCYEQQPDHRYPTLYLLHGQGFTDDQWDRLGVDEIADALIASDQAAPLLIVMPRYHNWYGPAKNNFGQAVVDVLLPWIDNQYRTQPERSGRAIGGLSRGGAWALHLAFTRPDLFGSVGAHSGFIFHTDMPDASRWLDEIRPEQMPRIYLDVGHSDSQPIMQSMVWLEEQLTLRGIPHAWHLFRGEHVEAYWQAHVEQYLRWYAEGW